MPSAAPCGSGFYEKLVSLAALLLPALGWTQGYSITWHKVAGGGGTSTGGVYSLNATIGQHDAGGPLTGGAYSFTNGFWALYAVPARHGRRFTA